MFASGILVTSNLRQPYGIQTFCSDHSRCRFTAGRDGNSVSHGQTLYLLKKFEMSHLDFIKIEQLYAFNGEKGFSE
jgi:isocitrate dehydrogenase